MHLISVQEAALICVYAETWHPLIMSEKESWKNDYQLQIKQLEIKLNYKK